MHTPQGMCLLITLSNSETEVSKFLISGTYIYLNLFLSFFLFLYSLFRGDIFKVNIN